MSVLKFVVGVTGVVDTLVNDGGRQCDILAHVGALGIGEENNGVAMSALRHLIESGKVSVDDAKAAVHAVQEVDAPSLSTNNNGGKTIMTKQSQSEKKDKPNSQKEKYRTRHVALQFSSIRLYGLCTKCG